MYLKVIQLVALCLTSITVRSMLLQGCHIQKFFHPLNAGRHLSVIFLSYWKYSTPALLAVYNERPLQQNKNTEMLHFQVELTGRRGLSVTVSNLFLNYALNNLDELSCLKKK